MVATNASWITARAQLNVIGGSWLASYPEAAKHLEHFLANVGTPLEINFERMNRESESARKHLYREIDDALRYAEALASRDGQFFMVTPSETSNANTTGDWYFAVNQYTTWARATVDKCGNTFSMTWHFYFRDTYDWDLNGNSRKRAGFVTDREMALLHRYGKAREYEMNGRQTIHFQWGRGQRLSSGVKVFGLWGHSGIQW
jgi:hypothetical protein